MRWSSGGVRQKATGDVAAGKGWPAPMERGFGEGGSGGVGLASATASPPFPRQSVLATATGEETRVKKSVAGLHVVMKSVHSAGN